MANGLQREVLGRSFQNPLLLAAGTAGFGHELKGVADLSRLGGVVTKSVSLEPRAGNPAPRVAEFRGGMLNSIGLANPGVRAVASEHLPRLLEMLGPAHVIVSVVGFEMSEYRQVIAAMPDPLRFAAFELNLSCPNTSAGGIEFGADPGAVETIVAGCRDVTECPIIAKLSPASPDLASLAEAAVGAGASGVAVVNTMPGRLYGRAGETRLGNGRGGVSGPALLPVGLQATRTVRESCPDTAVIGIGGVRSAAEVTHYLEAGADLVAVGTAGLADPRLPERIVARLEATRG